MSSRNPRDAEMLRSGSDRCRCPTCNEYFNSTYAFDEHRRGPKGGRVEDKRCLTMLEMQASGWTQGPKGHWRSPRSAGKPAPWQTPE